MTSSTPNLLDKAALDNSILEECQASQRTASSIMSQFYSAKNPTPAYQASDPSSPLYPNTAFYAAIRRAPNSLAYQHLLPIRSGHAWTVRAGQVCRITTPEGPQVGDLNIWNAHNPRERFWAARTRQLQRSHVRLYDRLWSCLPYLRPLVTVTGDSLGDYGVDKTGARCHDLLGTRLKA